ncbi:MAG: hypothetical protein M1814_005726 [Vezdaea aestivalis]|nr:MAG: hypothetical protein M1814_005726 [Vezdaea aestivalis]
MANVIHQSWTLTLKTLRIALVRHPLTTTIRAFLLPVIFMTFLAFARNLFIVPATYGIGSPSPVLSLGAALGSASGERHTLALVHNGFLSGEIESVIDSVASTVRAEGKTVRILSKEDELLETCRSTLRGVSTCFAAAVFFSSPSEGEGQIWNYTLRADGALGRGIKVDKQNNDAQIYAIPLQRAIDSSIASQKNQSAGSALLDATQYPYTDKTQEQRRDNIRIRYMGGIIDILAVAFFIAVVGVIYQLVGFMASERETGMSQLIEAMMPNGRRWEPQLARFLAYHLAFDIIYAPGWIVMSIVLARGVFAKTNVALLLFYHILTGFSLSSFSIFGAAFFKRAQLSGISLTIISLLLAIVAQIVGKSSTAAVAILGLLFPPMNYVFFIIYVARWERQNIGTDLSKAAPENPWHVPGALFWVYSIIHVVAFPIIGALIEQSLYGTASAGRELLRERDGTSIPVELTNFTKTWNPSWIYGRLPFLRSKAPVTAVRDLTLKALKGQIFCLLGANGSGKSTTLDAICGLSKVTAGTITVDGRGGLGLCPQKNVLWDDLTVAEHVTIFNQLKSRGINEDVCRMLQACGLEAKEKDKAKTLSGGQKRKLQLAMTFIGGSRVCCIDEVSSGLDPLSRRKIWDILLRERDTRTLLLTTHFLDEAELLADHIAILSKGELGAHGSAVELKHRFAKGYKVEVPLSDCSASEEIPGTKTRIENHNLVFEAPDSGTVTHLLKHLESENILDYNVVGPTIEDVFLTVVSSETIERRQQEDAEEAADSTNSPGNQINDALQLVTGRRINNFRQAFHLFRKRCTILRRNSLPHVAALLIPILAAGLVSLFLKSYKAAGCSPLDQSSSFDNIRSLSFERELNLVVGPQTMFTTGALSLIEKSLPSATKAVATGKPSEQSLFTKSLSFVGTLVDFDSYIRTNFQNVTPGGVFLGDNPTIAYKGNAGIYSAVTMQNLADIVLANTSISTQYKAFDVPLAQDIGKALQLITYFGLAMAAYPAFFALYPTVERIRSVRALQYSNGVRALPLWLAYVSFDFCFVVVISTFTTIIFVSTTSFFYNIGYVFVVMCCYGLTSALLAYVVSLFSASQLAAFAFAAAGQAVMFLLYFIGYLTILTYAPTQKIDSYLSIFHFTVATITPAGNLIRALFIALNVFSLTCRGTSLAAYPGSVTLYGGPILYLIVQAILLFIFLIWWDSGFRPVLRRPKIQDDSETGSSDKATAENHGLKVDNLSKRFKSEVAVDGLTFDVKRGEVFALLGPNGAGKSTTISLIRGDLKPAKHGGDVFVENVSVTRQRAIARSHLGVCPQFDAVDQMTVSEQLRFYAQIRGVADVDHNTRAVIRAVGLDTYADRMAAKLSGGNKRKLSLGVALMGNPTVLLLDEPSSGMDASAKRVMWKTLAAIAPGRSLVLTTHSMEEADALASRAGIMAQRLLAIGTPEALRKEYGDGFHIHIVAKTAPHTSEEEMDVIKKWVQKHLPEARIEDKTYHGQLKFSLLPSSSARGEKRAALNNTATRSGVADLFEKLELSKEDLGIGHYAIAQTSLEQVFVSIVGKHQVGGEE